MKRVLLCGNTGGDNRGCEAIMRSTHKVLKLCGIDAIAEFSFSATHDKEIGLNEIMSVYPYDNYKNQLQRIYYAGKKFCLRIGIAGCHIIIKL